MLAKLCHKASPSHHHVYRWYLHHSQSWLVYGIVLLTWPIYPKSQGASQETAITYRYPTEVYHV